jgi:glycosyltransferase 2 family protein
VRRGATVAFVFGVAVAAAATIYVGTGAVVHALEGLHVTGLVAIALVHLPIGILMGLAWWLACGVEPPAPPSRFIWGRFVRDAAAEVLPFSQLGGFVLGVRALGRGRSVVARGAVSMSVDLVIELTAKLPYVAAGLAVLLALAPGSALARPLGIALMITTVAVAIPLIARGRLRATLTAVAHAVGRRWPALRPVEGELQPGFDQSLAHGGRLFAGLALHLCCWFLGAVETWIAFHLLGAQPSLLQALAIDSTVAGLRTFAFMVPAAAGVQEASYLLGASIFGISPALAIAASFARRARDLTLGIATFGIALPGDRSLLPQALRRGTRSHRWTQPAAAAGETPPSPPRSP